MAEKILIVDDSPTILKFVAFSLKKGGFEVVSACDGMEAIEKMSSMENHVDLVITDLNMPNMDGYSLISTIRENEEYANLPIIILSSEDGDNDKEKGLQVGASSYLVKPFNAEILLAEVSKYLKEKVNS